MAAPVLSIVIPTHRRADILKRCIRHLEKQTINDQIEVIVVHDGPDSETKNMMEETKWNIPIVFFEIEKSQQGKARNKGVEKAQGKYVLFIGDDIFLDSDCCEKHLEAHTSGKKEEGSDKPTDRLPLATDSSAVLGFTTWDPAAHITTTMKWLERSGWQFGYPFIHKHRHGFIPKEIQHSFTYTSNISLPIDLARKHRFLEHLTHYGWEDMEWGHRLKLDGVPLYYNPDAKALHHHHIDLEDSLKRMEVLGLSLVHLEGHIEGLNLKPRGFKYLLYKLAAVLPTLAGKHRAAFLRGLEQK